MNTKQPFERPFIKKISLGVPAKFGMKSKIEPIHSIDGVSVDSLMDQFRSPLFVLSEKTIRQTYRKAYQAFSIRYPKVQFAWSYKTNYLDAVCRIFHQEGSWAEVVSGFEYRKALENGMPGDKIIFNGPSKQEEDLKLAIQNKSLIHIDHFDELFQLIELSKSSSIKPRVAIRINMNTGIYPSWDRFGFNYENGEAWEALNRIMLSNVLDLKGLHTHIGTYILEPSAYHAAASKLAEIADQLFAKYNLAVEYIDIGGGFASKNTLRGTYLPGTDAAPSFEDYAEAITSALINSSLPPERLPLLVLESGRALIDEAGFLLATILANKRLPDGKRAIIIDAGVNILFTAFWYDHQIAPVKAPTEMTEETIVYGPLCMNIDVIRPAIVLPLLRKGDRIVITRTGAYNMTQWMQFITYRPNVVLIDTKGGVHVIRKQENLETLKTSESIPDHLSQK